MLVSTCVELEVDSLADRTTTGARLGDVRGNFVSMVCGGIEREMESSAASTDLFVAFTFLDVARCFFSVGFRRVLDS